MAGTCIFCENKANSKEHALPKWIAKRFGLKGEFMTELTVVHAPPRKQPLSIGSHRATIFCDGCQKHFKLLEDDVADILTAMGRGEVLMLNAGEQAVLARWGAKTAFALIACERTEAGTRRIDEIPIEHRWPVRWGTVPKHVYVAYASYAGEGARLTVGTPTLEESAGDYSRRTYNAVLAFGQVLLKVFSVFEPAEDDAFGFPLSGGQPVFNQVWPPRSPEISWPLPVPIGGNDGFQFVPLLP